MKKENKISIAIIGAGVAGLPAIKHLSDDPLFECVAFEQNDEVGSGWAYTEETGINHYGIPVHSAMYKGLKSNLPKEVMEYPGFHYQIKENKSYLNRENVQQYLEDYSDKYGLKKYIKFNHHIKKVNPLEGERWEIHVTNLKTKVTETLDFDKIIISTGNFCHPKIPNIKGIEQFKGIKMHSFEYRIPSKFKDKKTVVVGSGFSGQDISFEISNTASEVYLSHHCERIKNALIGNIPSNFTQKGDIREILEDGVIFDDDSFVAVDSIVFCTGYKVDYPFLSSECGIHIENNHTQPLFKHIININHPTMFFLGVPIKSAPFPLFDLQARFAKTFLSGTKSLPSKDDMLEDTRKDVEKRLANGEQKKDLHALAAKSKDYFDELANFADIEPIDPVILRIFGEAFMRVRKDLLNYRKDWYKIIDKVHYSVKFFPEENPVTK